MALRRATLSASVLALCLVCPAYADNLAVAPPLPDAAQSIVLPPLPEAAEVVITREDIAAELDIALLLPALPEPALVVVDIAPDVAIQTTMSANTAAEQTAADLSAPSIAADEAAAALAITPAPVPAFATEPATSDVAERGETPPAPDTFASLPPPPEAASVDLSDIAAPAVAPAAAVAIAVPGPVPAVDPAVAPPAMTAHVVVDIAPALAARLTEGLKLPRLAAREADAVVAFYAQRDHKPMWHEGEHLSPAGHQLVAQLARAADDGLRAADYALPAIGSGLAGLAEAEIMLSVRAVQYARDARGARIDPRRLSALITPKLDLPAASDVLMTLASSADPARTLAAYQPAQPGYVALRTRLAELRAARQPMSEPLLRIPSGPVLRVGMRDDRIQLLRSRFGLGTSPAGGQVYDRSLSTVVAGFQRENGLPVNGILTRGTQAALNGTATSGLEADIIANMERWRWLPADLGEDHLIVNVPEYMVRKVEAGSVVHEARVVVGKSERPTPIFSDMMDHLVLNPSWTVPPTILKQDYLPKLAADPGYAERRGLQVIRRGNQITLRQPPGPTNALGNIKFMFPNDHAVYLHDTPSRSLFASARRAYSSGCVRVERPLKLAELVLGGTEGGWSERRLSSLVGGGERTIRLLRKLPIHITYMTVTVTSAGELQTHEDIYGFHRRTREALGL